jgi:hypothetical protein
MAKDTGIVNIHGKEYQTVAKRVSDFRELYKQDFSIETKLVERTDKDVVMKATIRNDTGRVIATGYAEEQRSSSMINKTSALENCETSAIGRALAAFGMAGTEYASADEVANAIKQQNTPKAAPSKDNPVSDYQRTTIGNLLRNLGIETKDEVSNYLYDNFGATPQNELEASEVIEAINTSILARTN